MNKTYSYWLPTSVDNIVNSFNFNSKSVLKKNIAYNIQYLQYIHESINNQITTNVLLKMRYKAFIVTAMSIIEAVFIALLDERNFIPVDEWKEGKHRHKVLDENTIEVTYKKKRTTPKKKSINFDEAIHLIEVNNVLNITKNTYPVLRTLENLRNHLHLNKAKDLIESDYNLFSLRDYETMQILLYHILNNETISLNNGYLKFIEIKRLLKD